MQSKQYGEIHRMNTNKKPLPPHIVRTPAMALAEFKYAVDHWFACMDHETRQQALDYAKQARLTVELKPNLVPR
jgi:hypothetical protein